MNAKNASLYNFTQQCSQHSYKKTVTSHQNCNLGFKRLYFFVQFFGTFFESGVKTFFKVGKNLSNIQCVRFINSYFFKGNEYFFVNVSHGLNAFNNHDNQGKSNNNIKNQAYIGKSVKRIIFIVNNVFHKIYSFRQIITSKSLTINQQKLRLTQRTECGNLIFGTAESWSGASKHLQVKSGAPLAPLWRRFFCHQNNLIQWGAMYVQGLRLKIASGFFSSCLCPFELLDSFGFSVNNLISENTK